MNKNKIIKYIGIIVLVGGIVDFRIPEYEQNDTNTYVNAGLNGEQIAKGAKSAKKGWQWLKSCVGCKSAVTAEGEINELRSLLKKTGQTNRIFATTEFLGKSFEEAKAQEEVLPKIGEYLSQTKPNENSPKVINCLRTEANEVKMSLYELNSNKLIKDKVLRATSEAINIAEYDVQAMQENFCLGVDGLEYVEFIIPRRPQFILNGQYVGRLYECMVFNIPKDIHGNWEKFKQYLIAFLNDLVYRPVQLWDEYWFRQGLKDINIDSRDVKEIERYYFANSNNKSKKYDTFTSISHQVA